MVYYGLECGLSVVSCLGMLRINYIQNNLGIDLLKEERPCMFFSADNMLGVKDTKHFYIYDTESKQEFNYNIHNGTLSPATANTTFDSLKTYAFSMLQTTEYVDLSSEIFFFFCGEKCGSIKHQRNVIVRLRHFTIRIAD